MLQLGTAAFSWIILCLEIVLPRDKISINRAWCYIILIDRREGKVRGRGSEYRTMYGQSVTEYTCLSLSHRLEFGSPPLGLPSSLVQFWPRHLGCTTSSGASNSRRKWATLKLNCAKSGEGTPSYSWWTHMFGSSRSLNEKLLYKLLV